ncbi:hypothetical protein SEPL_240 [Salmonella phage SE_PL]|uniref:hypothetical protein n=1 Tax=Salmonella enterica TaxID=28901 RepID=UPI000FDF68CA|nr:hypothetical protein CPT_Munch_185 [Salmonella phage Munch]EAR2661152.1 hypothetical protein [Salmonella enterica]ECV9084109.1 hypothetical protein [Salmonella enterica subsp. enterica serovar Infantis]MCP0435790.1 hypothetical protein [Salmonella enterica subsp. enterica serovar Mbandaka]QCW18868.1 hypothetical protein 7t3_0347 [Salmonella phage 7t3]QIG62853.1 hypothetical protein SEPL_240 [Salmonella phage SE_PL]WNV47293.1 hypothetical protein [Klebsiella phage fENko-Kae01]
MKTKRFPQDIMKQMAYGCSTVTMFGEYNDKMGCFDDDVELEVLHNEECNTTRWNSVHDLVFVDKQTGEAYHTQYEKGLTESQMLEPFDYDKDGVDCDIVDVWEEEVTYKVIRWKDSK